jgi:hypothetical protein
MNIVSSYVIYAVAETESVGWVQVIAEESDDTDGVTLVIEDDLPLSEMVARAEGWAAKLQGLFPGASVRFIKQLTPSN